jgi:ribosomal protein S18 acetylase RimI-like enzyme
VTVVPASTFTPARLAEIFNAGYEGYAVPIHLDEASYTALLDAWDIDLERSRVAVRDGEPVGIAQLGVRGDRAWIGGIGVAASARRGGIGRALMEAVLSAAPPLVTLEVIEQNEPAIRLYEDLGFVRTRVLEVWSLTATPVVEASSVAPSPLEQSDLPWQREDAALPDEYERLEVDGGAILLRGGNVLQLQARDVESATQLLSRGIDLSFVNVPEGDVAGEALRALGGDLRLRQFEYALSRSSTETRD